jgi:hypothetical protein
MKAWMLALALTFVAAAGLPTSNAQSNGQGVGLTIGEIANVTYAGTGQAPVSVVVGCATVVAEGSASPTVHVAATDMPPWLSVTAVDLALSLPACVNSGNPTGTNGNTATSGTVSFTVTGAAPGVVDLSLNLTATVAQQGMQPAQTNSQVHPFHVEFHPNYTITPDVTFPLAVHGGEAKFNLTVSQDGNAEGMVMMINDHTTAGQVKGLSAVIYKPGESKKYVITYTAPDSPWTTAYVNFTSLTHSLVNGKQGPFMLERNVTWKFTNAGGAGPGGSSSTKSGPGPDAIVAIAIVGAALVAASRRQK